MSVQSPARRLKEIALIRRLQETAAEQEAARTRRLADQLGRQCQELQSLIAADQLSWLAAVEDGGIQLPQATAWSRRVLVREGDLKRLLEDRHTAQAEASATREAWAQARSREGAAKATADRARKDEQRRKDDLRQSDLEDQFLMRMRTPCV